MLRFDCTWRFGDIVAALSWRKRTDILYLNSRTKRSTMHPAPRCRHACTAREICRWSPRPCLHRDSAICRSSAYLDNSGVRWHRPTRHAHVPRACARPSTTRTFVMQAIVYLHTATNCWCSLIMYTPVMNLHHGLLNSTIIFRQLIVMLAPACGHTEHTLWELSHAAAAFAIESDPCSVFVAFALRK